MSKKNINITPIPADKNQLDKIGVFLLRIEDVLPNDEYPWCVDRDPIFVCDNVWLKNGTLVDVIEPYDYELTELRKENKELKQRLRELGEIL